MVIIDKVDLAIEVINKKIAKEINENTQKDDKKFEEKILNLKNEKKELYQDNEEVVEKVLKQYAPELGIKIED